MVGRITGGPIAVGALAAVLGGICRLAFDPARARSYLEAAFLLFEREGDVSGTYESWASIIDSFVYEWSDFHPLDQWLQIFRRLQHSHPEFPSAAIEAHVSASVFNALMWRRPGDPICPMGGARKAPDARKR